MAVFGLISRIALVGEIEVVCSQVKLSWVYRLKSAEPRYEKRRVCGYSAQHGCNWG